jgi:hypothetical protein
MSVGAHPVFTSPVDRQFLWFGAYEKPPAHAKEKEIITNCFGYNDGSFS